MKVCDLAGASLDFWFERAQEKARNPGPEPLIELVRDPDRGWLAFWNQDVDEEPDLSETVSAWGQDDMTAAKRCLIITQFGNEVLEQ